MATIHQTAPTPYTCPPIPPHRCAMSNVATMLPGLGDECLFKNTLTESLFDIYPIDFYLRDKESLGLQREDDNANVHELKVSSCGHKFLRRLHAFDYSENGNLVFDGPKEFSKKIKNESSVLYKKSEIHHFTFKNVAKNYPKFIRLLRKNGFCRKGQKEFPDLILYERKHKN